MGKRKDSWVTIKCQGEGCNNTREVRKCIQERYKYCTECSYKMRSGHKNSSWKPKVNLTCDYCGNSLNKIPSLVHDTNFCNRECQGKYHSTRMQGENNPSWGGGEKVSKCDNCGKLINIKKFEVPLYDKHFCNKECHAEYQKTLTGKKNNFYGKNHKPESIKRSWENRKHIWASKEFKEKQSNHLLARWQNDEELRKIVRKTQSNRFLKKWQDDEYRKSMTGENSVAWQGGLSRLPYPIGFRNSLKKLIRKRDNYTCQVCGTTENGRRLSVHHIDYDKDNLAPENLVSCCHSCHSKTNFDREHWEKYFKTKSLITG
jgi:5-methylcytosine-specific restriction endonuclease McrA